MDKVGTKGITSNHNGVEGLGVAGRRDDQFEKVRVGFIPARKGTSEVHKPKALS